MNVDPNEVMRARQCIRDHGVIFANPQRWLITPSTADFMTKHLVDRHQFSEVAARYAVRFEFRVVGDEATHVPVMVSHETVVVPVRVVDNSPDVPGFVQPATYEVKHLQHTPTWESWQVLRTFQGQTTADRHWPDRLKAEQAIEVYTRLPHMWGAKHMQLAYAWKGIHPG